MRCKSDIGFGKKIRRAWLDLALELAASGRSFFDAKDELTAAVGRENAGIDAIRKILVCLNRIWLTPPDYCRATRDHAVRILEDRRSQETRFLLHWGMSIAAYPFVGNVAETIGRLLKLQGSAKIADIQRRLGERFGDRDFVHRIVRYNVSSFLDWGAIREAAAKGEYTGSASFAVNDAGRVAWLAEAVLHTRTDSSLPIAHLRQHPMLFPFSINEQLLSVAKENPRIQVLRHSLNEELVSLRERPATKR